MYSKQKHSKLFYGWYVVGACLLITMYTAGIVIFGFTAVFEPIAEEFGWSYTQISLGASLRGLEISLLAPLMGLLVDRWGPRRLVFAGSIIVCIGFIFFSRISSLAVFYGAFAVIAIGMSACSQTVLMAAVNNWFRKRVGLAIGIVASGTGLGGILVPVIARLIDVVQWRMAMLVVGLGMLVIVLPLSVIIRHKPENYGYQPDGEMNSTVETMATHVSLAREEVSIPARQAIKSRAFWHVTIGTICHTFLTGAIIMHIMPYLSSIGIARSVSSLVAFILPVASVAGRLSSSWLSGIFGSRRVFTASFILMTIGLVLFSYVSAGNMWLLLPFIIIFSLAWGCQVTLRVSMLRKYFGRGNFGTILGFSSGLMTLGMISGAPIAGWIFDTWGSYQVVWLSFSTVALAGAVLLSTAPSASHTIRMSEQPGT